MTHPETTAAPLPSLDVSETAWAEIAPTAADLHVILTSDRFFSGKAAIKKAEELRRLVGLLQENGVAESAVSLEGASLDVSSGLFTRSSSVTYRVRIHLADLDLVGAALDAVANAKSARLSHVGWDYTGPNGSHAALLGDCAARAAGKAKALAQALDMRLAGVRTAREVRLDHELTPPYGMAGMGMPMAAKGRGGAISITEELAGLELAPKKKISVRVDVTYDLAPSV